MVPSKVDIDKSLDGFDSLVLSPGKMHSSNSDVKIELGNSSSTFSTLGVKYSNFSCNFGDSKFLGYIFATSTEMK